MINKLFNALAGNMRDFMMPVGTKLRCNYTLENEDAKIAGKRAGHHDSFPVVLLATGTLEGAKTYWSKSDFVVLNSAPVRLAKAVRNILKTPTIKGVG